MTVEIEDREAVFLGIRCLRLMLELGDTGPKFDRLDSLIHYITRRMDAEDLAGLYQESVQALREMPYPEYLRSDGWQQTRWFALERAGRRCQTCNRSKGLHVHHRTYDRRGQEHLDDLTVLCADCHSTFHENRELAGAA